MKVSPGLQARLQFLCRVVEKESRYLQETDARLFEFPLTPDVLAGIAQDSLLAERLDAFVGRLGRLQDTLGDKFLPALLDAVAERKGAAIENLDRAEKLGWLASADEWLEMRILRNQMVHEYIEDFTILADALNAGHIFVPSLANTASRLVCYVRQELGL